MNKMNKMQFNNAPSNVGYFYKSIHSDGKNTIYIVNLLPSFKANPKSYSYEIYGTDKTFIKNRL